MLAGNAQSLLEALIEDIAQTLPLDNMIANAQLLADENHSDAHDVSETRHQHSLNGLKPGPHTCHKQNLLQRHRLVGRRVAVPVSTHWW